MAATATKRKLVNAEPGKPEAPEAEIPARLVPRLPYRSSVPAAAVRKAVRKVIAARLPDQS